MTTVNSITATTRKIGFQDFQTGEYCSLFDEDGIDYAVVSYAERELIDIMAKLPATGLGFDLTADVSQLFGVEFFNEEGEVVSPTYHGEVTATVSTFLGTTTPSVVFESVSKHYAEDRATFYFRLNEVELEQVQAEQGASFYASVTLKLPSDEDVVVNAVVNGPADLRCEAVERVALNLVSNCDKLYRAPEWAYGENVFTDCEDLDVDGDRANCNWYWVNTVKQLPAAHSEVLSRYMHTTTYNTLLQDGEVEIKGYLHSEVGSQI